VGSGKFWSSFQQIVGLLAQSTTQPQRAIGAVDEAASLPLVSHSGAFDTHKSVGSKQEGRLASVARGFLEQLADLRRRIVRSVEPARTEVPFAMLLALVRENVLRCRDMRHPAQAAGAIPR
jgi:hypothetical protein